MATTTGMTTNDPMVAANELADGIRRRIDRHTHGTRQRALMQRRISPRTLGASVPSERRLMDATLAQAALAELLERAEPGAPETAELRKAYDSFNRLLLRIDRG